VTNNTQNCDCICFMWKTSCAFPNTEIDFHVYLRLMVSHCTGESFSKLRRIKNYLRSSIWQEKVSMLSQMSTEHEILGDTEQETIINDFVCKKCGVMKCFVADFFQKAHIDRVTEIRVISISLLLNILRNLTPLRLPYNGNGLLFHTTQPTSRSTIKAIAYSKPTISEN